MTIPLCVPTDGAGESDSDAVGAEGAKIAAVMLRRWLVVVAVAAGSFVIRAQPDIAGLGPQVGQRAIDFSLPDQNGRLRPLKSLAGSKGTMLVFFRSADW